MHQVVSPYNKRKTVPFFIVQDVALLERGNRGNRDKSGKEKEFWGKGRFALFYDLARRRKLFQRMRALKPKSKKGGRERVSS